MLHYIWSLIGLQILIVIHELGHFASARWCGMRVSCFSVGFGPRILSIKRGETEYQLAAIPLGGFVQITGMSIEDTTTPDDPCLYSNKPMWQRFWVVAMGPIANFILAFVLLSVALQRGVALEDMSLSTVGMVEKSGPADMAGLQSDDRIVQINGAEVHSFREIVQQIHSAPSASIQMQILRGSAPLAITIQARENKGVKSIGIGPGRAYHHTPQLLDAVKAGFHATLEKTADIVRTLRQLITGKSQGRLMGLPGIMSTMAEQMKQGLAPFFYALAILSINLGLFNLFPLPALDGGRLIFLMVEKVRGKPANAQVESVVHTVGFVLMMSLLVWVSIRDVLHLR